MKRGLMPLAVMFVAHAVLAAVPPPESSEPPIEITNRPAPARTKGWAWNRPPGFIRPESGRRSHVFYVGEPVRFSTGTATQYEVRDYWGNLVDKGPAGGEVTLKVSQPGWYKLYLFRNESTPQWGDAIGDTTFVIFRNHQGFPPLPPADVPGGFYPSEDQPMRGVTGMGPQRHSLRNPEKPDEMIKLLSMNVELDKKYYLPFDPVRKRVLMCAFPNGTKGRLEGIRKIVEHFKNDIRYWEPRNEPNFGASGAQFVREELADFYKTIKSVDPGLKVMGPGTVSIGPMLMPWLEDFFRAGGARFIDVFSFHIYNGVNGDVWLARWTLDGLMSLLAKYGVKDIEKWQTEQGFFAAVYGAYQPRLQGRWTMIEMMIFDQYGIPKEHNHLWYDRSHGFWDFPTWWINEDGGGMNPAGPLMRVWSEELYGTLFAGKLSFGKDGDKLYLGNMYASPDGKKRLAAIMNVGCGRGRVEFSVRGGNSLKVVSPFGVESTVPVRAGRAVVEVPELPIYIELEPGQTIEVIPQDWGVNLARLPGVRFVSSGSGKDIHKIANGHYENWYYAQKPGEEPWADDTGSFPAWLEVQLPSPQKIARVVLFSCPPWQNQSTLVEYELQVDEGGRWKTVAHVSEPLKTFGVYSCVTRTTVDSFFADRWVFEHTFGPVTTQKIRLFVKNATWGGGATQIVQEAGGQTGLHRFMLRELEIYGPPPQATVRLQAENRYLSGPFAKAPLKATVSRTGGSGALELKVNVPESWSASPSRTRVDVRTGSQVPVAIDVIPPATIPAGKFPVRVELIGPDGSALDSDEVALEVFAPVELSPQMPTKLDAANQTLSVVATNITNKGTSGTLRLELAELVPGGRGLRREQTLSLEPFTPTPVEFVVPGVDLAHSAWQLEYSFVSGKMLSRSSLTLAIRAWMTVGPFPNQFETEFGPEKGVDLAASYQGSGGRVSWKETTSDMGGFVDLTKVFQPNQHVSAYAVCYVKSPSARKAILSAGSDDGIRCWLNGTLVVNNNVARGAAPGQEKVPVELKEGWNEVLLKITQGVGGWGFYLDFLSPDGQPMKDLVYSPRR